MNKIESDDFNSALREIWNLNKDRVEADLLMITQVVHVLGELQQAREAAHRLVGGLGVFGMNEAERSARSIESLLVKTLHELGDEATNARRLVDKLKEEIASFDAKI